MGASREQCKKKLKISIDTLDTLEVSAIEKRKSFRINTHKSLTPGEMEY